MHLCREKKGFGSVSRRFSDAERDNPGPGAYVAAAEPTMEWKHDSIGRKGYGPMASRDKRWKGTRVMYSPGPGEYSQKVQALEQSSFNRAPATAAFHPPVRTRHGYAIHEHSSAQDTTYAPQDSAPDTPTVASICR